MKLDVTDVVITIMTDRVIIVAIANVTDATNLIVKIYMNGETLFRLKIRPAVAKIIPGSHNILKELKFNISKSECHVIISMAFFLLLFLG